MSKKDDLKEEKIKDEPSNLRLILYGEPQQKESRIYYSPQSDCYQQSMDYLTSLDNIEIIRENGYSDIEYVKTKEDDKNPHWKGILEIESVESGSKVKFQFDFKDYFRHTLLLGLKGSILVSIFLMLIIGSYDISNLIEPWFILTIIGLIGVCFLFLGAFLLDRSENTQKWFIRDFSEHLETRESDLINKALEEFREKQIKEILPYKHPPEVICGNCQTKNKYSSTFCVSCGLTLTGCSICLLKIGSSEEILKCPHCNAIAHKRHLLEWLKIKGVCPVCKKPLKWSNNKLIYKKENILDEIEELINGK